MMLAVLYMALALELRTLRLKLREHINKTAGAQARAADDWMDLQREQFTRMQ